MFERSRLGPELRIYRSTSSFPDLRDCQGLLLCQTSPRAKGWRDAQPNYQRYREQVLQVDLED